MKISLSYLDKDASGCKKKHILHIYSHTFRLYIFLNTLKHGKEYTREDYACELKKFGVKFSKNTMTCFIEM